MKPQAAHHPSARVAVWAGMLALAAAMGIGRFSFTPVLPLMQQDAGVTLAQGSWLATANYIGYLAGALICIAAVPAPRRAIRWGLAAIAAFTLAMGTTENFPLWLAWRLIGGAASAFVLVGVSGWAMPALARHERAHWSGHVFAGVGVGICLAGLVGLAAGLQHWGSRATWLILGALAGLLAVALWAFVTGETQAANAAALPRTPLPQGTWPTVICYGVFGYGYIIPATFLPALARHYIDDPAIFGWVWPVFGAAAAASTILISQFGSRHAPRRVWVAGLWVLSAGVLAPVLMVNLFTLCLAALCVGGTFMVITMAGIQEARRIGGAAAPRLVATMTAAFAIGQIVGPVTVPLFAALGGGTALPSIVAALALVASSFVLARGHAAPAHFLQESK
jgi:predicted MFS family arabinose efflux permease